MMTRFQKAGGAAALAATLCFLFAFALAATALAPMTTPELDFGEYLGLYHERGSLIYLWHFAMYIVLGLCLTILVLALHERLKEGSPALSRIAAAFGLFWTAFVFWSGLITIQGDRAVLALAARDPAGADALRRTLAAITLGIDSSDRLLGCLWVGLASVAALKTRALPRYLAILGLAIGAPGLVGILFPSLLALSYVFGLGVMLWWAALGVVMLRGVPARKGAAS